MPDSIGVNCKNFAHYKLDNHYLVKEWFSDNVKPNSIMRTKPKDT